MSSRYFDKYPRSSGLYARWSHLDGTYDDGWPHNRDEDGWCLNCDAPPGCGHARLLPRKAIQE